MHDLAKSPGEYARLGFFLAAIGPLKSARLLLLASLVQPDAKPRTMAGVPSSVKTIDAFVGELIADTDPAGVPAGIIRPSPLLTLLPGECALAQDIIEMAIDAAEKGDADARAWLQDRSAVYSARLCFEALGVDYDAVRKLLVQRWMKEQG